MQQERKEAGEGEPGRALTIEQREEQGKINIQLVPCLTRETEAAVVLLPCSFQAHLTGSREGTPAPSDVIIFYFLIISPPPFLPRLSSSKFRTDDLSNSAREIWDFLAFKPPAPPLHIQPPPRPPTPTPEKQQRQPTPKSLFFQKRRKKNEERKKNQRWDESWREPGGGFSACVSECVRAAVGPSPVPLPRRSLAL